MNIEGRKIVVDKSVSELNEMLNRPQDYKNLMPEGLQKFETTEDGFTFALKGMPEISLKIEKVSDHKVSLISAKSSLEFSLNGLMTPLSGSQTEVQLVFEGKFNPFIKMMVEKPLKNFIETLTTQMEKI